MQAKFPSHIRRSEERQEYSDGDREIHTEEKAEDNDGAMAGGYTTPDPALEEEERSGDYDWGTEEDLDREREEEDGDLERKRERERLEMEREREELERETELEKEREQTEEEEEEWERRRAEMERGGDRVYDEETGQPYPYPPQYFFLKVRA